MVGKSIPDHGPDHSDAKCFAMVQTLDTKLRRHLDVVLDAQGLTQPRFAMVSGAVFRRVIVRRYSARAARGKISSNLLGRNARWDNTWFTGKNATPARTEYDVGDVALHSGSITPIFREILRRE